MKRGKALCSCVDLLVGVKENQKKRRRILDVRSDRFGSHGIRQDWLNISDKNLFQTKDK